MYLTQLLVLCQKVLLHLLTSFHFRQAIEHYKCHFDSVFVKYCPTNTSVHCRCLTGVVACYIGYSTCSLQERPALQYASLFSNPPSTLTIIATLSSLTAFSSSTHPQYNNGQKKYGQHYPDKSLIFFWVANVNIIDCKTTKFT